MKKLIKEIQAQFDIMCATGKLFRSSISGQTIWDTYLSNFKSDDNPIFRDPESSSHNCNLCNNFIRRYGNIVAIDKDNNIVTLWDNIWTEEYVPSAKAILNLMLSAPIADIFMETYTELNSLPYEQCNKQLSVFKLGIDKNVKRYTKEEAEKFGVVKPNEIRTFNHLHLNLPKDFVYMGTKSIDSLSADYRSAKDVFKKGMETISEDTLKLVKDLINQDSILDGQTHLFKIEKMIQLKVQFDGLPKSQQDNWCWVNSYNLPIAKFRNELIGTLCSDLSEGMELNTACQTWNKRVDPANYMKATAPITQFQINEARVFVEDNGYSDSFARRYATIDDIKASEILHLNAGDGKIKEVSLFDNVKSTSSQHKKAEFDKVEEISIDKFMETILPTTTSIEAFLANNHEGNMVTLTTSNIKESKPIFKWDNNYSWTFNGNIAGKSQIKEAVKSRGGNTDAVVRVTLAFPNTTSDYDLHLIEPTKKEINYHSLRTQHPSSGMLDLDAQGRDGHQSPEKRVENITYTNKSKMLNGNYRVYVHNYSGNTLKKPFLIEVEIEGDITIFESKSTQENSITCFNINLNNGVFTLIPTLNMNLLESKTRTKEIYGLESNKFHKVNLVCLSPNHWDNNNIGNKHYMFMLDKCHCPTSIRSFHAENLIPELAQHRKVLEVLGNTTMIAPTDVKQLSGLGFNATVRDELIVRVQGTHKRMLKIKF